MAGNIIKGMRILWARLIDQGVGVTALWAVDHLVRIITGAPMRSVSQITPKLHVGGQYRRRGWGRLRARGITSVVNLRIEFDDEARGIAPERYLYLPTVDDAPATLADLHEGVTFIREGTEREGGVYVHCGSGVGRAPTMAAAYLVSTGVTPAQAWERIRAVRPFIRPQSEQVSQVARFAKASRRRDSPSRTEQP